MAESHTLSRSSISIYDSLRERLTGADFGPGERLKLDRLKTDYGCAVSTMREVLFRLAHDGFVEFADQRGFRAPSRTATVLNELLDFRIILEQQGASLSMDKAGFEWEAQLTGAHHKLAAIDQRIRATDDVRPLVGLWSAGEREFHRSLIGGCGSSLLIDTHSVIYDRCRQHIVINSENYSYRPAVITEHSDILEAVIARDKERCLEMIDKHLRMSKQRIVDKH